MWKALQTNGFPELASYPRRPNHSIILGQGLLKPVFRLKKVVMAIMWMLHLSRLGRAHSKTSEVCAIQWRLVQLGQETATSILDKHPKSLHGVKALHHLAQLDRDKDRLRLRLMGVQLRDRYEIMTYERPIFPREAHFFYARGRLLKFANSAGLPF